MHEVLELVLLYDEQAIVVLTGLALVYYQGKPGLLGGIWVQLQDAVVQKSGESLRELLIARVDRLLPLHFKVLVFGYFSREHEVGIGSILKDDVQFLLLLKEV